MSEPSTKEVYPETADIESSTDAYAARFSGSVGAWMLKVQTQTTFDLIKNMDAKTVLDVGGGHGQLAEPLCQEGYDVTVFSSHESCKHRIKDLIAKNSCQFRVGNVIDLPYEDNSFDLVISFRLVTHCEAWQKFIAELCRVSKQAVIIDYPTSHSLNAIGPALFRAKKLMEKNTRSWRLFHQDEIEGAIQASSYRIEVQRGQYFLPMVLHRMLKFYPASAAMEGVCRMLGLTRLWGSPIIAKAVPID